jgi:hypothetical protein
MIGTLKVLTTPETAYIEINGKPYGQGFPRATIPLPEGRHKISIDFGRGAIYEEYLTIQGGITYEKSYDKNKCQEKFVNPCLYRIWARNSLVVSVDGLPPEEIPPLRERWVPIGAHLIVFMLPGIRKDAHMLEVNYRESFETPGARQIILSKEIIGIQEDPDLTSVEINMNNPTYDNIIVVANTAVSVGIEGTSVEDIAPNFKWIKYVSAKETHQISLQRLEKKDDALIKLLIIKAGGGQIYRTILKIT